MEDNTNVSLENAAAQPTETTEPASAPATLDAATPEKVEEVKTEASATVPSETDKPAKKPKRNLVGLLIMLVGVVCIVCGFVLGKDTAKDEEKKDDKQGEEKQPVQPETPTNTSTVKNYNEYTGYRFTTNLYKNVGGVDDVTTVEVTRDKTNKIDYIVTTLNGGVKNYNYNDYGSSTQYASNDNMNWTSTSLAPNAGGLVDIEKIVQMIVDGDPRVSSEKENTYKVILDYNDGSADYKDVILDVTFEEGFIRSISFDLSSFVQTDGISTYIVTTTISSVNSVGELQLPVLNNGGATPQQPSQEQTPSQEVATDPNQAQTPSVDENTGNPQ